MSTETARWTSVETSPSCPRNDISQPETGDLPPVPSLFGRASLGGEFEVIIEGQTLGDEELRAPKSRLS